MREDWQNSHLKYLQANYSNLWKEMMRGLISSEQNNCFWLQGPANYFLKTNDICWGVDIAFRDASIFNKLSQSLNDDLHILKFVILTHEHRDHYDIDLIKRLSGLPIIWVIPDFFDKQIILSSGLCNEQIIWMQAGKKETLHGIEIEAFNGIHWNELKSHGVPSLGYYVNTGEKRLLFPGDVREYNINKMPVYKDIDGIYAHVWLGRGNAQNCFWDSYLHSFCSFFLSTNPKRIYLTHLYDVERPLTDMWTYSHCGVIMDELQSLNPSVEVMIPRIGKQCTL